MNTLYLYEEYLKLNLYKCLHYLYIHMAANFMVKECTNTNKDLAPIYSRLSSKYVNLSMMTILKILKIQSRIYVLKNLD